jgi:putative ABC transport system substrate-binding protein
MRRIGVLNTLSADDPESPARRAAFLQGLHQLGWIDGRNVRIEDRWGAGDIERIRRYAEELIALAPEVILSSGSPSVAALQQATHAIPIVFVNVVDAVGAGYVESMARPGANVTGFTLIEYGTSGKWLELLKEVAPSVTRVAVIRDPTIAAGSGQLGALQGVATSFRVELSPLGVRDAGEIERAVTAFARGANGGMIVLSGGLAVIHRERIIALAARHRLPAVYPARLFITSGGLMSCGPDTVDPFRRAAVYVDRILKGEKPADLPVQAPTKYETVINLKTARALGLDVPETLLSTADEVIK